MRILLVLLALPVFYSPANALQCYHATVWFNQTIKTDLQYCDHGVVTCVRPRFINGAYVEADPQNPSAVIWGCGECAKAESCTITTADRSNNYVFSACFVGKVGEHNVKLCDDREFTDPNTSVVTVRAETSCHRPRIDLDGNFMTGEDATWGCGECPEGSDSCVSCDGHLCNYYNFQTYSCLNYVKSNDNIWMKDNVTTTVACKSEKENGWPCKMPTPDNKAVKWNPCGSNCEKDGQCKVCYGNACNDLDDSHWCKVGPADSDKPESLPSKFCGRNGCLRPRVEYGKLVDNAGNYSCADDDENDCNPDICARCDSGNDCNKGWPVNNHKCYVWSWDKDKLKFVTGELSDCNRGDAVKARCNKPLDIGNKTAYTPATNDNGCGKCSAAQSSGCITTFAEDNKPPTKYQCYSWSWVADRYVMGEPQDCNVRDCDIPSNIVSCNLPEDLAIHSPLINKNGCGECSNASGTTIGCKTVKGVRKNVPSYLQCYTWVQVMNKYVPGVLRNCTESDLHCNKPRNLYDQNSYDLVVNKNGCGRCDSSQEGKSCITTPKRSNNDHQCFSWSWVNGKYEPGPLMECSIWGVGSTFCNMPENPEDRDTYSLELNLKGCGGCNEAAGCITTYSKENKDPTHKCYRWTKKQQGWINEQYLINCYLGDTEDTLRCSMPRNGSIIEGFNSDGCGPCPEQQEFENCETTRPEKNSGYRVLMSLVALIFGYLNLN